MSVHQTGNFKLENLKNPVQIDRRFDLEYPFDFGCPVTPRQVNDLKSFFVPTAYLNSILKDKMSMIGCAIGNYSANGGPL